jgi:hypothetical protein
MHAPGYVLRHDVQLRTYVHAIRTREQIALDDFGRVGGQDGHLCPLFLQIGSCVLPYTFLIGSGTYSTERLLTPIKPWSYVRLPTQRPRLKLC